MFRGCEIAVPSRAGRRSGCIVEKNSATFWGFTINLGLSLPARLLGSLAASDCNERWHSATSIIHVTRSVSVAGCTCRQHWSRDYEDSR